RSTPSTWTGSKQRRSARRSPSVSCPESAGPLKDNLRDEWERVFHDMVEDLGLEADEQAKITAGKALLRRLRDSTAVTVRPRYNEPFFARGRRHVLADSGDIGWHPDFESRVEELLSIRASAETAEGP
ncbi:ABC-three component system protein, partial [Spirillospora sp. NPDC048824]|uniref:ABC-three component system protein n=1 Tax=Spirillospora sp. NPDC048824 TaxID=3364526 RepID=UPI003716135F